MSDKPDWSNATNKPPAGVRCELYGGPQDGLVLRFPAAPVVIRVPCAGERKGPALVDLYQCLVARFPGRLWAEYDFVQREKLLDRPLTKA
jgi:hypothetical protein